MDLYYTKDLPSYWYVTAGHVTQRLGTGSQNPYDVDSLDDAIALAYDRNLAVLQRNVEICNNLSPMALRIFGFYALFNKRIRQGLARYNERLATAKKDLQEYCPKKVVVDYLPQTIETDCPRLQIGQTVWLVDTYKIDINRFEIDLEQIEYYNHSNQLTFSYAAARNAEYGVNSFMFKGDLTNSYSNYRIFLDKESAVRCLLTLMAQKQADTQTQIALV